MVIDKEFAFIFPCPVTCSHPNNIVCCKIFHNVDWYGQPISTMKFKNGEIYYPGGFFIQYSEAVKIDKLIMKADIKQCENSVYNYIKYCKRWMINQTNIISQIKNITK